VTFNPPYSRYFRNAADTARSPPSRPDCYARRSTTTERCRHSCGTGRTRPSGLSTPRHLAAAA